MLYVHHIIVNYFYDGYGFVSDNTIQTKTVMILFNVKIKRNL